MYIYIYTKKDVCVCVMALGYIMMPFLVYLVEQYGEICRNIEYME